MRLPHLPLPLHLEDHKLAVSGDLHPPKIPLCNLPEEKKKPLVLRFVVGASAKIETVFPEEISLLILKESPCSSLSRISPGSSVKKTCFHEISPPNTTRGAWAPLNILFCTKKL
jgi:hypothetical protein